MKQKMDKGKNHTSKHGFQKVRHSKTNKTVDEIFEKEKAALRSKSKFSEAIKVLKDK